jgi:hypothetical protein
MRVPIHENVLRIRGKQLLGRRAAKLVPVTHVDRHAAGLDDLLTFRRQSWRIRIAVDSSDGRDRPQFVEHGSPTDVSRVENL